MLVRNLVKYTFGIFLGVLLIFAINTVSYAHTPQDLYDQAWKLVNANYIDKSMNNQNWQQWRHKYDAELKTDKDAYVAIDKMLESLNDPYTRFLPPGEFHEENTSIKGNLKGIGVQITEENNRLLISALYDGTPASKSGLKPHDCIVEIDGKSTAGMSIDDAANSIRGQEGTYVNIVVNRFGEKKVFNIQREDIDIKSISTITPEIIDNRIGYIKISSFMNRSAASEFFNTMKQLGNKSAYIIDVRSNPGGLVYNALYISNLFLNGKSMLTTVNRTGYNETIQATKKYVNSKPIVILVNEDSASASEIFCGAMKDNYRAVVVGEKTFGKGLVQEIYKLPGGSGINITIQKYLTPSGADINKKGITPDYVVKMTDEDIKNGKDPQFEKAQELLVSKLNNNVIASK